jgi:hypothetical protein
VDFKELLKEYGGMALGFVAFLLLMFVLSVGPKALDWANKKADVYFSDTTSAKPN